MMKMGYVSKITHVIFIIIIFLFLSLQNTQQLYFMEENEKMTEKIEEVSGKDEREENETFLVEKFRALLGIKSFQLKKTSSFSPDNLSPSPAPAIESESPAPAPVIHTRSHSHPPLHHSHRTLPLHRFHGQDDNGVKKIVLIAVLVSSGAAFLLCVLGFIWVCRKMRKQKKKPTRTTGRSKYVTCQNSESKVSSKPEIDLFYLNALGMDLDLEQQSTCIEQNSDHGKSKGEFHERKASKEEILDSEFDSISSFSIKEIMSVHDDEEESVKCESDNCANSSSGDSNEIKIVSVAKSHEESDDESFHSFVDSHSSNFRPSNASACSFIDDTSDKIISSHVLKSSPPFQSMNLSTQPESQNHDSNTSLSTFSNCPRSLISPPTPPPPPPPLPPRTLIISAPRSSLHSKNMETIGSTSSSLSHLSSPMNLDTSLSPEPYKPSKTPAKNVPSPPTPPLYLKGNNSSLKTPPPPLLRCPHFVPLGKDGAPLPKLKPLHWDKVRAAPDRKMVWDKIRSSSFELDEEMIESLFGYNLQHSMKNDDVKSKSPSPRKQLLDPKRIQNLTILSKALNVTAEQVSEALEHGEGLRLRQLEALVHMVPSAEEEAKLLGYTGDTNELGSAEKFVKIVLKIPYAFKRAEAMLYRETFEDEVVHLRNSFSMLEEACKELRSSRLFLKLLEAVLKTGNRMNIGTIRGGAKAFKLEALLKLSDIKGTDGKTTLLHFVVQEIIRSEGIRVSDSIMGKISQKNKNKTDEEKEEDYRKMGLELVAGLSTELYNVKKTASVDIDVLANSVSSLSDGMTRLHNLISNDQLSGNFIHSMKSFLNYAENRLIELQKDEEKVLSRVKEIAEYFHGDVSKDEANPLKIFVIVRDFLGMLDHVCKELRSLKVLRSPSPLAPFR